MPCVSLSDVTYAVGSNVILKGISVDLCGGLDLVLGPNGAGKTTLLKVIAGVVRPQRGLALIDGEPPSRVRSRIAYIPAHLNVDGLARVVDVAESMNYGSGSRWRESLEDYLERLGIGWALNRRLSTLSSGEQRLITIAAALSRDPDVVIADEPTAFLDLGNQAKVYSLFRQLSREGVLVIAASHDVHYASLADSVVVLDRGKVAYAGRPEGLNAETLTRVYGVKVSMVNGWGAVVG